MRILISGASGFVGQSLTRALQGAGHQVWHLVRRKAETAFERRWDIDGGHIDLRPDDVFDAVIHLAGASIADRRWSKDVKKELLESRIQSTRLLASTLAAMETPPEVLISASAIGIYGANPEDIVTEASAHGSDFLAVLCSQWEAATEAASSAGIRVVHPRFGIVLGANGGVLRRMVPLFEHHLGGRIGDGQQWLSWIALSDVHRAMQFLLCHSALSGPVNFCSPNWVNNEGFTQALRQELSVSFGFSAPATAIRLAFGSEMAEQTVLANQRVFPQELLNARFKFQFPTIESALAHELARR